MRTILLFGAGRSATVLIDFLIAEAAANDLHIIIADADKDQILLKTKSAGCTTAIEIDINDIDTRAGLIKKADVVISMMPAALHFLVAKDCLLYKKHVLTASYVDDNLRSIAQQIKDARLLFLCEMGLDPGIDHMSAMKIIDEIKQAGGQVTSFKSHCGGLVAPESDDNPWNYKVSWNPRNIVLAGKAGAIYKVDGNLVKEKYEELFEAGRGVMINEELGYLNYYPNRDSLSYIELYHLTGAETFLRTTLRYPDFIYGWNNLIELQLTDEKVAYDTDGLTLAGFFHQHFAKVNFPDWMSHKLKDRLEFVKHLTEKLDELTTAQDDQANIEDPEGTSPAISIVDEAGELIQIDVEEMKLHASKLIAAKMHEANLTLKQLFFLGMDDDKTVIDKGMCSPADVLQFILEKKLLLLPQDKDMIVMLHEFEYLQAGISKQIKSTLVVKGEDSLRTAMAKTVGLPLGIAAIKLLNGEITLTGLHIPTDKEIYVPVLKTLEDHGIVFVEIGDGL